MDKQSDFQALINFSFGSFGLLLVPFLGRFNTLALLFLMEGRGMYTICLMLNMGSEIFIGVTSFVPVGSFICFKFQDTSNRRHRVFGLKNGFADIN